MTKIEEMNAIAHQLELLFKQFDSLAKDGQLAQEILVSHDEEGCETYMGIYFADQAFHGGEVTEYDIDEMYADLTVEG